MDLSYILSQVFVVISYVFIGLTYFAKDRRVLLFYSISSLVMSAISYVCLSAWSGFAMVIVAFIRNIIFLIQNKKDSSEKITYIDWIILAVLVLISGISAVITYDGFLSLFSVFATLTYSVSVWQKNKKVYNIMGVFVSLLWIVYGIFIKSIFGVICEGILLIVEIVSVIKCLKDEKTEIKAS